MGIFIYVSRYIFDNRTRSVVYLQVMYARRIQWYKRVFRILSWGGGTVKKENAYIIVK